jgi:hypothetical protein
LLFEVWTDLSAVQFPWFQFFSTTFCLHFNVSETHHLWPGSHSAYFKQPPSARVFKLSLQSAVQGLMNSGRTYLKQQKKNNLEENPDK